MRRFKIAHLYPDLMEVYSDRGNVMVLAKRLSWRGYEVEVDKLSIGDSAELADYDIVFSGGGEDREQALVAEDLLLRRNSFERALKAGTVVLTICGTYQLMGHYFETLAGKRIEGIGLLDLYTIGSKQRLVGNAAGEIGDTAVRLIESTVVGYENHSGRTFLGNETSPWFKVLHGAGNNGQDEGEGAQQGRLYGTYYHGPLLAKNPHLADHLILQALERHDQQVLTPLQDDLEMTAHREVLWKMQQAKTR